MNKFEHDRLEKMNELKAKGVDPYGKRFDNIQSAASIINAFSEEKENVKVRAAGRIVNLRPHGKAGFLDIKDRTGKLQVYVKSNKVGEEKFEIFQTV